MIGGSRSIGTYMLPGRFLPWPVTSPTTSEPTPTSLPSRDTSAAPLHSECAGAVKIAPGIRYSQPAANSRRDMT